MKRLWLVIIIVAVLGGFLKIAEHPRSSHAQAPAQANRMLKQTCHAEVKFNYMASLHLGPSAARYGIERYLLWNNSEMRVFGRNEASDWYQVELQTPYKIGWVHQDNINLYGQCGYLPITTDNLLPETAPPPPPDVPLPEFANHLQFTEQDEAFLVNEAMIYIRRQSLDPLFQAHMLIADLSHPDVRVKVHVGAIPYESATLVSDMVKAEGAFAAINGDFYGGNYMPQGLTVVDNEIVTAPLYRAVFAVTEDNDPYIGYFTNDWTWPASIQTEDDGWIPMQLMNLPCDPGWMCLYSDAVRGLPARDGYFGTRVLLSPDYEVLEINKENRYFRIPEGHYALLGGTGTSTGNWIDEWVQVGDTLILNLTTRPAWQNFDQAIGGGPIIIKKGEFVQDCDEALPEEDRHCELFDPGFRNSHYYDNHIPRTAVGYRDNLLYMVVVEGYEVDHSNGVTQRELADFMIEFGVEEGMEFDGGGSSALWLGKNFVSDFPRAERRLSNALLLLWNGD